MWSTILMLLLPMHTAAAAAFDQQALITILEAERIEQRMPGLRAAVRLHDGRLISAAVGLADREAGTPLDDRIGMPGGSTGKTFAALLTLRLVEDGALSLDDPASKWLGDQAWFRKLPNAETMQVRHLLSHSSGLRDYPGTFAFNRSMVWRVMRHGSAYFTPEELIGFADGRKPLFEAGKGYRYTDAGYLVLGRVLEAAGEASYYELLQTHVLEPLDVDGIRPQIESAATGIATGYMGGGRNLRKDGRMKFDPRSEWTGGGLITTPTLLVEFFGALEEQWPQHLDQMAAGGWRNPKEPGWHYGYGIFVNHENGTLNHGGLWPGYRTRVTHVREAGLTIAVQTNRDGKLDLRGLVSRIAHQLREEPPSP